MKEYAWPGNVRQLQNMIYQFLVLGKMDFLDPASLNHDASASKKQAVLPLKSAVEEFEKDYIKRALALNNHKRGAVAGLLGMDRKTLFRKMKRYGLA